MPDHTYKLIELVGTSEHGVDAAIQHAISRASQTIRGLDWFEVVEVRGQIATGAVKYYQVTLKVGFRVLDPADLTAATEQGTPLTRDAPGETPPTMPRPDSRLRERSDSPSRLVEDAVMGPAETALEASGERSPQSPA